MESIDIIATKKPFLYQGKRSFRTNIGGVFTFLFFLLTILISAFYLQNLFFETNYSGVNKIESSNTLGWDPVDIKVLLKINKTEENIFYPYYQINEKIQFDHNSTCNSSQMKLFEEKEDTRFSYYCVKINSFLRWSFKIRCFFEKAKKMGLTCDSKDRVITYKIITQKFITENDDRINMKIYNLSDIYKNNTNFYYNFNKAILDYDYIFNSPEIHYYSDISNINSYPQYYANNQSVMSILLEFKPLKSFIVTKTNKKFNDELANLFAVLQLILLVLNFFYYLAADYLFERESLENLLKLYDIKDFTRNQSESRYDENICKSNLHFYKFFK